MIVSAVGRLARSRAKLPSALFCLAANTLLLLQPAASNALDLLAPIDVRRVRVAGEIGRRVKITIENNLLQINHEADFLASFRRKDRAPFSYVGLGKQIDAAVRFAYYTQDERVIALKERLVAETVKTQLDDGYIGIFADKPPSEKPPELGEGGRLQVWWDIHEMSYIILGLVSDYRHFGNEQALAAARKAADYIIAKRPAAPLTVHVSTTGLETALVALAQATGDEKYRTYANLDNSLARWQGEIEGHAYNQLCVALAQLELYRADHDPRLLAQSHRLLKFLTDDGGMLASGACSRNEGWHITQKDTGKTAETCATAYLIRWLDRLLQIEGKAEYGDLMERAIYNALFAAQSPDGRELRKYTPLTGPREYYAGEKSSDFKRDTYCCPNNYRRIVAELPGMIYYRSGEDVVVNLYCASQLDVKVGETPVKVTQETDYPSRGNVRLRVDPASPIEFAVKLRIPAWCPKPQVRINGQLAQEAPRPGSFFTINRTWRPGDRVELDLPMLPAWHKGTGFHAGEVALLYGPLVFCVNPQRQPAEVQERLTLKDDDEESSALPVAVATATLVGPLRDDAVRPGGLRFSLRFSENASRGDLVLTEFADPGGVWSYVKGGEGSSVRNNP